LWEKAKNSLKTIYPKAYKQEKDRNQIKSLDKQINELNKLYGNSFYGRYPDTLPEDKEINIQNMKEKMEKIKATLGGYVMGLSQKLVEEKNNKNI
ncbi:MAG: hypothetical protein ACOCP8_07385, partial [archaeon]